MQRLLSVEELAQRAGVSKGALLRIEHNRGRSTWRTLRRLAGALGVEPSVLPPEPDAADASSGETRTGADEGEEAQSR